MSLFESQKSYIGWIYLSQVPSRKRRSFSSLGSRWLFDRMDLSLLYSEMILLRVFSLQAIGDLQFDMMSSVAFYWINKCNCALQCHAYNGLVIHNHKSMIISSYFTSQIQIVFILKEPSQPVSHFPFRFSPLLSQASGHEQSHWTFMQSTLIIRSFEKPIMQSEDTKMASPMWLFLMLNFQFLLRLNRKEFSSERYPLKFFEIYTEVNPPIIWLSLVQMSTSKDFLLQISEGCPTAYLFMEFLRKSSASFFFWNPSVVRKLASLGRKRLLHPTGSLSNYNRDEYISSSSSSSKSSSVFTAIGAGAMFFDFLNPGLDFDGSETGFDAISFRRCPGTIWLCMVFDSSSSSSQGMYFALLPCRLYGFFSSLSRRSSSFLMRSLRAKIQFLRSRHIFSKRLMMLLCSLSILSFSSSLVCNLLINSFNESMLAECSTDFALKSLSSLVRQAFQACNSSFFFFSQVFYSQRVSQSLIFFIGSMTDSVSLPAESRFVLKALLQRVDESGCNFIIERYQLLFLLRFASSRKISLYSCELRDLLSMSSNFSSWYCASLSFCSSLQSLISKSISVIGMPLACSDFKRLCVFTIILNNSMGHFSNSCLLYLSCSYPSFSSCARPSQNRSCSLKR